MLSFLLASPGCSHAPPDCAKPEVFCIGLVTETGRVDDRATNQAAWEGIQQAKAEGLADKTATIETIDSRDYEENMRVFAEAGYDVIVTVGTGSSAATYSIAGQSPKSYFIGADQRPSEDEASLPNLIWLVFPEDRLGFLAGALAAAMTQTNQVGAVSVNGAWPAMKLYGEGFIAGAQYSNADVKATVTYHNDVGLGESFNDPAWGTATANTLVDGGTDVIFGIGGTTGSSALDSAATRGAFVIGADIDQYFLLPVAAPRMLTSVLKLIAPGVTNLLRAAKDAQTRKSAFQTGVYIGQIGFAPYHELATLIPEDVKQRMLSLPQALLSGEIRTGIPAITP